MTKFLHTADLHIDSPLRGLAVRDEQMMQRVQQATRTALERIIDLALQEKVAFVLIAGDLFDGDWKDMRTGQWAASQFRRLANADIGVYYIRGNHDAVSQIRQKIRWPENVHELSPDSPETHILEDHGVAIHGQGFADRAVTFDLAATYPQNVPGMFNIGLLHTSLTGSEQHDTYAPTSVEVLKARAYDSGALWHIHLRGVDPLCTDPYVAYSGNPQGRHIREAGAKGCLIGETDGESLQNITFHPTDTLRWQELLVDVTEETSVDGVIAKAGTAIETAHRQHEGRSSAFRLTFQGATRGHADLSDLIRRGEILGELHAAAEDVDDEVWLEKIRFTTKPPENTLSEDTHDLWGAIAQQFDQVRQNEEATRQLAALAKPVLDKVSASHVSLTDEGTLEDRLPQWIEAAQQLLRSRLGGTDA